MSTNQYNFNPSQYHMGGQREATFWDWLWGNQANVENLNRQIQNYNYQVDLQSLLFQREDNAVYRKMKDLMNAGLNPALATAGGANAGSVVATSAPTQNFNEFPQLVSGAMDLASGISSTALNVQDAIKNEKIRSNEIALKDNETLMSTVKALTGLTPEDGWKYAVAANLMNAGQLNLDNVGEFLNQMSDPQEFEKWLKKQINKGLDRAVNTDTSSGNAAPNEFQENVNMGEAMKGINSDPNNWREKDKKKIYRYQEYMGYTPGWMKFKGTVGSPLNRNAYK